jgi:hypothetical protein
MPCRSSETYWGKRSGIYLSTNYDTYPPEKSGIYLRMNSETLTEKVWNL